MEYDCVINILDVVEKPSENITDLPKLYQERIQAALVSLEERIGKKVCIVRTAVEPADKMDCFWKFIAIAETQE